MSTRTSNNLRIVCIHIVEINRARGCVLKGCKDGENATLQSGTEVMRRGLALSLRIPAEAFGFLKGGAGSGAGLFQ
jgi:hypothetical protein